MAECEDADVIIHNRSK